MSLPPTLRPADEIWSESRRHLEWSQGFALFFLFGRPHAIALIRDRLVDTLRLRSLTLQRVVPDDAGAAPEQVIGSVLNASNPLNAIGAPLWVELDRHPDDPTWDHARSRVLTALNERRFLLERDIRRPVIFVLPLGYRRPALEIAPDLWQVRTFSADVGEATDSADVVQPSAERGEQESVPLATPTERAGTLLASVQEWDRIKESDPERVALSQGWLTVSEAMRRGEVLLAHRVAREVVEVARLRQQRDARGSRAAHRELVVSLGYFGDAASRLGQWEEAERAYREGLELAQRVLAMSGETPETLRDKGALLERIGDIVRERGRLEEAERVYRERLDLARRILAMRGRRRRRSVT